VNARSGTCPFCPHPRHDDSDCRGRAAGGKQCECCGPTDKERAEIEAPGKILDQLREVISDAITYDELDVTEVVHYTEPDFLQLETKHGRFKLTIERVP